VRHAFVKEQACPSTGRHRLPCPGWQIDHVQPLKCNGPDNTANLQWLTVEDHKAKTKREARLCRKK
jgi:5-methylcytosine-specific restriction endonuclease McrA